MSQTLLKVAQADDPREGLLKQLGNTAVEHYQLMEDDILLATYIRPEKTKGGIILTQQNLGEDRFQGKVGLLVKKGPAAWKFDRTNQYPFEGDVPEIGAWCVYRASEGWEIGLNGVSCRIIRASLVRGVVADPSVVW